MQLADDVTRARQHSVGDLLRRTARRYPDKLAIVDGAERLTFAEFDAAVNRCAFALAERGLVKGDRLGLLSHNCWQFATVAFATARLGVVLVPINFMLTAPEIAFILTHSGASGMVVEDELGATADDALAAAGVKGGVRGWIGGDAAEGWEDVAAWLDRDEEGRIVDPGETGVLVADDDPLR